MKRSGSGVVRDLKLSLRGGLLQVLLGPLAKVGRSDDIEQHARPRA